MRRQLLKELHKYFENIGAGRSETEESLLSQLTQELPYYQITSVSKKDLDSAGFDISCLTDEQMEELADEMSDDYCNQLYRDSLEIIAYQRLDIPKITDPRCPNCGSYKVDEYDENGSCFFCNTCNYEWRLKKDEECRNNYVLVEFPEETGYFEAGDIGYPCFNSEDNGARYVPEEAYIEHFGHEPQPNSYFRPVRWPQSQEFLGNDDNFITALCEPIVADEKALADFGTSAIWVPLCFINNF